MKLEFCLIYTLLSDKNIYDILFISFNMYLLMKLPCPD